MRRLARFLARIVIIAAIMVAMDELMPFVLQVKDIEGALFAAGALAAVNSTIRPVLMFVAMPLRFVTIGLFTLIVDAFMLEMVSVVTAGAIATQGFWYTVGAAFIIGIGSTLMVTLFLGTER